MNIESLIQQLREKKGLRAKKDIQPAARIFPHQPFPNLGQASLLGDDAAVLPAQKGKLLIACEGMHPSLVAEDPWFAGWCAVLVNLSDIAAMGGRPVALLNSIWTRRQVESHDLQLFALGAFAGEGRRQCPGDW